MARVLALAALIAHASAQTALYLPGFDQQPLAASVIGSDATATTYLISPAQPTGEEDPAGVPSPFTLVEGPATVTFRIEEAGAFTLDVGCQIAAQQATCTTIAGGPQANFPGTETSTEAVTSITLRPATDALTGPPGFGAATTNAGNPASTGSTTAQLPSTSASPAPTSTAPLVRSTTSFPATSTSSKPAAGGAARLRLGIGALSVGLVAGLGLAIGQLY